MEILKAPIYLKKAEPWDVMHDHRNPRNGQTFWLKSEITGHLDNKPYIIGPGISIKEIKLWLERGMIYVPASDLDLKKMRNYQPVTGQAITQQDLKMQHA